MSKNPKRSRAGVTALCTVLILVMIAATGLLIYLCIDMVEAPPEEPAPTGNVAVLPTQTVPPTTQTEPPETTQPEPEVIQVVSTATVGTQGDLLMHQPVFESCRKSGGGYDFESIFRYCKDVVSGMDYAIANLETTFGGEKHPHVPNQSFSCPDELAASAAEAGYDMLLTANNHAGDSLGDGITRTLEVTRAAGLATLGSQPSGEKRYTVTEINGIRIGMAAYTWAFSGDGNAFSLNGLSPVKDEGQMNYFTKANPDKLYTEAQQILADMKADGAEAAMMFIHWGEEYEITENGAQRQMAQKLCDMGFDVIVGGHAHVVQPMELLESTLDPSHKTVCIYSLGNAVSNQRTGVSSLFPTGYTEDGALFSVSFEKYSDGKVYVSAADVLPTWVNMHSNSGSREYNILPLDEERKDTWKDAFALTDANFAAAEKSYDRTMGIVGEGLAQCQTYLEQAKADREAYYYDLAYHPEKYGAEAVTEPVPAETTLPDAA